MSTTLRAVSIVLIILLNSAVILPLSRAPLVASAEDPGVIAYVRRSSGEIRLVQPDGTNDRSLWQSPLPDNVIGITNLEWRPDGGELAFSSGHERTCSWYETDVYTISANGSGVRRITNSPACAQLASYPQGSVKVNVIAFNRSGHFNVYMQGSSELKGITLSAGGSGEVTFDNVADFGAGIFQPPVAIYGLYRYFSGTAPDVQAGQSISGPDIWASTGNEFYGLGTGKLTWRSDGSQIGYAMRNCSEARQISPNPPVGSTGQDLPTKADIKPCLVDWAPTASKADQFLYHVDADYLTEGVEGIWVTSTTQSGGGTQLVSESSIWTQFGYDPVSVRDLKWLPDGSGFLFTQSYVYVNTEDPDASCMGTCSDVFEFQFTSPTTGTLTQLTRLGVVDGVLNDDDTAYGLSISPDGRCIALERVTETSDPENPTSAIWVMGRDGSGLRQLVSDGWSPAWGKTAAATEPGPTPTPTATPPPSPSSTPTPGATPALLNKRAFLPSTFKALATGW